MSAPDYPSQPTPGNELEDRAHRDAADLAETARHDLEGVGTEIKEGAAAIGEEAREQLEHVAEKAKGMADQQKQLLVDQMSGVSSALDQVAGELEQKGEGSAQYIRMVADGADKLTSTVSQNNVDDILAMAQDFGRKQPVAFMGAAALLGFVASRFIMASASRRAGQAPQPGQYQPPAAPSSYAAGTTTAKPPSYVQPVGGNDAGL